MAQNLAQDFIDLRRLRLASQPLAELRLNHAEHRLDVRAFVVVLFELRLVELIEVIHALPQFGLLLFVVVEIAKRDVRNRAFNERQTAVVKTVIALVGRYFFHLKAALRGRVQQRREVRAVVRVSPQNLKSPLSDSGNLG